MITLTYFYPKNLDRYEWWKQLGTKIDNYTVCNIVEFRVKVPLHITHTVKLAYERPYFTRQPK